MVDEDIKVVIVTDWNCNSGIFTYSKFLVEELNKHKCVKVSITPINNPHLFDLIYFSFENFSLRNIVGLLKIVVNILSANRNCDIIHFQEPVWAFSPIVFLFILLEKKLEKKKAKIIVTIHEVYFRDDRKPLIL